LSLGKEESLGAIGFITTDDFYGFYVTWDFALTLLTTMENIIKQLPDDIFLRNNFEKENILFFSTMASGDYMQEMLDASVKMFN